jgi:hypothetical protein
VLLSRLRWMFPEHSGKETLRGKGERLWYYIGECLCRNHIQDAATTSKIDGGRASAAFQEPIYSGWNDTKRGITSAHENRIYSRRWRRDASIFFITPLLEVTTYRKEWFILPRKFWSKSLTASRMLIFPENMLVKNMQHLFMRSK